MKKIFLLACCIFSVFNTEQAKCMNQQQASRQECIQVTYADGTKCVEVQNLNLETKLQNAVAVQIKNLSESATNFVMYCITNPDLTNLRTLVIEGCSLSDRFPANFNRVVENNPNLSDVHISDSNRSLTGNESLSILKSLALCEGLGNYEVILPAITDKTPYSYLASIINLNAQISLINQTLSEILTQKQKTQCLFQYVDYQRREYRQKLRTLSESIGKLQLESSEQRKTLRLTCLSSDLHARQMISDTLAATTKTLQQISLQYIDTYSISEELHGYRNTLQEIIKILETQEMFYRDKIRTQCDTRNSYIQLLHGVTITEANN